MIQHRGSYMVRSVTTKVEIIKKKQKYKSNPTNLARKTFSKLKFYFITFIGFQI